MFVCQTVQSGEHSQTDGQMDGRDRKITLTADAGGKNTPLANIFYITFLNNTLSAGAPKTFARQDKFKMYKINEIAFIRPVILTVINMYLVLVGLGGLSAQ